MQRHEGALPCRTRPLVLVVLLAPEIVVEPIRVAALFLLHLRRGHEGEGIGHRPDLHRKHGIVQERLPALQELLPRERVPITSRSREVRGGIRYQ